MLDSRTRCTPTQRDLIPSQADCAVRLVERDANISGGTDRNMARTPADPPGTRLFFLPLVRQHAITLAPVG